MATGQVCPERVQWSGRLLRQHLGQSNALSVDGAGKAGYRAAGFVGHIDAVRSQLAVQRDFSGFVAHRAAFLGLEEINHGIDVDGQ